MKFSKGKYRVTRFCCTSGLCCDCHSRGNHGDRTKRERIVHTYDVSREWAEHVCNGWRQYEPAIEEAI